MMRTIGVRALKAQLSQILRDVQRGDHILVTDRGRVVAELHSPNKSLWATTPAERAFARLASEGHLRVGEPSGSPYQPSPISSPDGTAQAILDEERGER